MAKQKSREDHLEEEHDEVVEDGLDAQTIALRIIAGLLLLGAASMLSGLLVPFVLAIVAAIAFSQFVNRLESLGLPRALTSLICVVLLASAITGTAILLAYQAGTILQDSDKYLDRISEVLGEITEAAGGTEMMISLGIIETGTPSQELSNNPDNVSPISDEQAASDSADNQKVTDQDKEESVQRLTEFWSSYLRRNLQTVGRWIAGGIGGFIGLVGQIVIFLAFLFYILLTREDWIDRIGRAATNVGLRPRPQMLTTVRDEIRRFLMFISLISLSYVILITILGFFVGLPSPPLWGILTGLLVFVPYFGPITAGVLLTLVALATNDGWWQPATVLGVYLFLQTVDSYLIAPVLYGRAIKFNPVTILFAVLFFGWLWGPLGLIAALPVLVLLRALVNVTPDTPALQALIDPVETGAS